jgi:hypothetical protein
VAVPFPKLTEFPVAPKFAPVTVTKVLTEPEFGLRDVIVGAETIGGKTTLNVIALLTKPNPLVKETE